MFFRGYKIISNAIAIAVVSLLLCSSAFADNRVGVIVPELRAPFKIIFDSVVDGVDDALPQDAIKLTLNKDYKPADIVNWVQRKNIDSVITLGGLGKKASLYVPGNIPIVNGALLSASGSTNKHPGVALTPDPKALFNLLYRLDATRKKVIVVYNPSKNQWVVDLAKRQTEANGVRLVTYKATDIKQAAIIYNEIFTSADLGTTALWLLQDRKVVDSKVVLPFILEKAWQKKIVVFSSALSHVKKGVLFSKYPDNKLHGQQLAKLIKSVRVGTNSGGNKIYPSTGLQEAINIRTAEHLGLSLSRSKLREFDVVFPVSN